MGIVLKVTPETLNQMSGEIEKEINGIEKQFQEIDADIRKTASFWEGEASDLHRSQYDAMKDDIAEVIKRLKDHPVNLLKMAGIYTETEAVLMEVSQSLVADVIV